MDFTGFPYLGIWTQQKPFDTNYICIEPWLYIDLTLAPSRPRSCCIESLETSSENRI